MGLKVKHFCDARSLGRRRSPTAQEYRNHAAFLQTRLLDELGQRQLLLPAKVVYAVSHDFVSLRGSLKFDASTIEVPSVAHFK